MSNFNVDFVLFQFSILKKKIKKRNGIVKLIFICLAFIRFDSIQAYDCTAYELLFPYSSHVLEPRAYLLNKLRQYVAFAHELFNKKEYSIFASHNSITRPLKRKRNKVITFIGSKQYHMCCGCGFYLFAIQTQQPCHIHYYYYQSSVNH